MYNKIQMNSLHEIARAAESLHRALGQLRDQAVSAMTKMEEGKQISAFTGPISNQTPFEVVQYTERLQGKIYSAMALKVDQEHIQWAHDMGVADMMTERHEEIWNKIAALADAS